MADPAGNSGIRATGLRPVAILKKDNYKSWAVKLKVQLKVMDCWELVTGTKLQPPATAPVGADAAALTAALALRKTWDKKRDGIVVFALNNSCTSYTFSAFCTFFI